jgi:U3 small nucleolar RNA-associated protein 14
LREVVTKAPRKKNEVVVSKDSASAEKSKHKLKKQTNKLDEEKGKTRDDAQLEISMTDVLTLGDSRGSPPPPTTDSQTEVSKTNGKPQKQADAAEDSDGNSEVEEQEKALVAKAQGKRKKKGLKAFEQRDLVALAFAGDNVVRVRVTLCPFCSVLFDFLLPGLPRSEETRDR